MKVPDNWWTSCNGRILLDSFNQSSSKHWKLLNKLEKGPNQHTNAQTFISNGLKICDDQEIAENFASNL